MLPVPTFVVVSLARPLRDKRDTFAMGQGVTVEDAIVEAAHRAERPLAHFAEAVVVLDDQRVPREAWASTRPHPGQTLIIKLLPGAVVVPLITAIAAYAAPGLAGLTAGSLAAIGLSAGITLVGALVSMALAPTPKQTNTTPDKPEKAVNSIAGVANQAKPYGVIPRIFGRIVSYYPPLATTFYTELASGNDQYLRVVFCLGYGPVTVSNIKIGTTPIGDFEGVAYEVRQGYTTDPPVTLYPAQVREESLSIELRQADGYSQRRTTADTDEASIDVVFPNGLQRIGNRNQKFNLEVEFEVGVRRVGTTTWSAATLTTDQKNVTMNGAGRFVVRGNTKATLRRTVRLELPTRGRYDVRIRRVTTDDQSDTVGKDQSITNERSYWTVIRSHRNEHPLNIEGIALIALRIRASDQLNGIVDQLNCTVQAILPTWSGSAWVNAETRSPAWALCEVLRGAANARPVADSRIDLDAMVAFDDYCTAQGITFDGAIEDRGAVWDVLQDIVGTANASFWQSAGPFSVVIDQARDTPVQHFTPRNSRGFQSTKVFARRPHAIKVRFPNELTNRQWDEIYVYEAGYSVANATIFEALELPYTSTARQAWRRGRRALFAARLRPEIYSAEVDAEHLACTAGDLVRFTHDIPLWGVGSARVKALATSGSDTTGVTLDAPLPMESGVDYAIRFRLATGATLLVSVDTDPGAQTVFTFTAAVATASGPAVGDLALFGVSGSESVELLVRSIEPLDELGARLTFVDYSPEIFESGTGAVPDFDPQITLPAEVNRGTPVAPTITSIDSGEAVLVRASDGTLISRIVIGVRFNNAAAYVPAEELQARFRPAETDQDFAWLPPIPAQAGQIAIAPVDDGATYDIELRSRFAGVPSEWVTIEHTVVGKTSPPPDVDQLYRQGAAVTWPYPDPPIDLAGFLVRANFGTSTDWSTARPLHTGIVPAPPFDISGLSGTQTVMVKAVDTSGIESATQATLTMGLGDLYVENVVATQSEAPSFGGTIEAGTVSGGGVLEADVMTSSPFYRTPAGRFYPAASDPMYPPTTYYEMNYTASFTPAADQLTDATLKLDATVTGDYVVEYRIATSPAFYPDPGDPMFPTPSDPIYGASIVGEWGPWPGELGPFESTAYTYQIKITVAGGTTQGAISAMDLVVDTPDIEELYEDQQITVAANGVRLTPAAARRAIDVVVLTLQDDAGTAVTLKIMDKNPTTGALIKAFDAAGSLTTATFDARTKAH